MPDLLDLPQPVIEQIAKVRIDKPFYWYMEDAPKKRYAFWVLRRLCWATRLAAWPARHAVVKAELGSVAIVCDAEWCRVILAQREHRQRETDSALILASSHDHMRVAELLLAHGAGTRGARSAMLMAESWGHSAIAAMLRAHVESSGRKSNG